MSSEESLDNCFIGSQLSQSCHSFVYSRKAGMKQVSSLDANQIKLISLRTGLDNIEDKTVCFHHEQTTLFKYSHLQKKCCDPFLKHKKAVKAGLREVSLEASADFQSLGISIIPGHKMCPTCHAELSRRLKDFDEEPDEMEMQEACESDAELECDLSKELVRESLDSSLVDMDVSPMKLHAVASHSKVSYGKRKLKQVQAKLKEQEESLQKKVAEVIDVMPEDLDVKEKDQHQNIKVIQQKAEDLDVLVQLMKDKLKVSNRQRKIQILTMAPRSWSIQKTKEEFQVSEYIVRQARKLASEKGILELPDQKRGKAVTEEVKNYVTSFYSDDEFSRQMPGKKDFVSMGKKVHMQKRLLLCDLKELYSAFKKHYPNINIGFSKFCSLRPKWCILVGRSGTHSVCVCTIHQNVTLMLNAIKLDKDYHELMSMLVCDRDSKECMVHRCPNCPETAVLTDYLLEQLLQEEEDDENADEIRFQQWTTVDRSELLQQALPVKEFVEVLVDKMNDLTAHSYIARAQAQYLKQCKEELADDSVIILGDFAENFKFIIQDEVQSYHWNQQSCTLHPVVVYFKKHGILASSSLCFISDDLNHDTSFVHKIMGLTMQYIKENIIANVKKAHYFSDGCAGQYKNCKNFINLCMHQNDFSVDCVWTFFATSHGKSPCDGIGGTLKRLTTRASLQRPLANQILTAKQVFEFCQQEVHGINVFFVSHEEMEDARRTLEQRFSRTNTLPGTRGFHHFVPVSASAIAAKRVSEDKEFALEFDLVLGRKNQRAAKIAMSDFIVCLYDGHYWVGLVDEVDEENDDVRVKFMHPHFPSRSYCWPSREDKCFVPTVNVLCRVEPPSTNTGRQYKLESKDIKTIEDELKKKDVVENITL